MENANRRSGYQSVIDKEKAFTLLMIRVTIPDSENRLLEWQGNDNQKQMNRVVGFAMNQIAWFE